jgi:hypothetical protein
MPLERIILPIRSALLISRSINSITGTTVLPEFQDAFHRTTVMSVATWTPRAVLLFVELSSKAGI